MALIFSGRRLFAIALVAGLLLSVGFSRAAVQMSTGLRINNPSGTVSDCSAKAQTALGTFLTNPKESSPGSGEWLATGPVGGSGPAGPATASATIRCFAVGKGYVVTFTCAIVSGNPYNASQLCIAIGNKFQGKDVAALPTPFPPTPVPSGCATNNLVGTWQSNDNPNLTFKMELNGDLSDNQGVSGNWILDGMTATVTYYGNHTMTLSSDGKHLSGGGYNLTRKC